MTEAEKVAVEQCEQGHKFAKLPDHPRKDGLSRCPHCMAIGLDAARALEASHPQEAVAIISEFRSTLSADYLDRVFGPDMKRRIDSVLSPIEAAESGLPERVEIARLIHGMCYGYEGHNPNSDPDDEDLFAADKILAMFAKAGKPGEAGNG